MQYHSDISWFLKKQYSHENVSEQDPLNWPLLKFMGDDMSVFMGLALSSSVSPLG